MVETTHGVGAWRTPKFYGMNMADTRGLSPYSRQRIAWTIIGIQEELIRQGFLARPKEPLNGVAGPLTDKAIKAFQKSVGLAQDGHIGAKTSGRLFYQQFAWWQITLGIPSNFLVGVCRLESGFDPGAEGYVDDRDRGICQFNRYYHPDITDEIAFSNPPHCIAKTAQMLVDAKDKYGSWDCAIASHNNPSKAKAWESTGFPPDEQIAQYVNLVKNASRQPL